MTNESTQPKRELTTLERKQLYKPDGSPAEDFDVNEAMKDDENATSELVGCFGACICVLVTLITVVVVVLVVQVPDPKYDAPVLRTSPRYCHTLVSGNASWSNSTYTELLAQDLYINGRFFDISNASHRGNLTAVCFTAHFNASKAQESITLLRIQQSPYAHLAATYPIYTPTAEVSGPTYIPTVPDVNITLPPAPLA